MAGKGGGGSWKVAYADFVTAMMAFFLVMWITAQDKKVRAAIAHHFNAPYESVIKRRPNIFPSETMGMMPKDKSEGEQAGQSSQNKSTTTPQDDGPSGVEMEMLRQLNDRLLKVLSSGAQQGNSIRLELTGDGLNITVFNQSSRPIFQSNSAEFTEYGTWVFETLAWEIARFRSFGMQLEGHTLAERAPTNSLIDQWDLSTARANAARRVLVKHGVNPDQVHKVSGCGDTKPMPKLPRDSEMNNRVTVALGVKQ